MAHWVSSRPRDDTVSPPRRKQADWRATEIEQTWKKRLLLVAVAGVLTAILLSSLLVFRNQDVNALTSDANKKLQAVVAERDDLKKKLSASESENNRLKAELARIKGDESTGGDSKSQRSRPQEQASPK
jgi:cell shape-determining protein MreC